MQASEKMAKKRKAHTQFTGGTNSLTPVLYRNIKILSPKLSIKHLFLCSIDDVRDRQWLFATISKINGRPMTNY